jgi:death on curing protein
MEYLTPQQILFIHHRLVATTGGPHGLRDADSLQAAAARPQAIFAKQDPYPDLFSKAAALLESLIRNHPFLNGNKRTAITAAGLFLLRNGYSQAVGQRELYEFTLRMATGETDVTEARNWFERHSGSIP